MHSSSLIPVEGHDGLYRDLKTNSIVNTDEDAYLKYVSQRNKKREQDIKLETAERDINLLKDEIAEIKNLLLELVNKNNN